MPFTKLLLSSFLFAIIFTLQVNAQVVKTPGSNARVVSHGHMPVRGLTKPQVEAKYGQPNTRKGPVGDPAIYRWDYNGYSVYFEHSHVIHSVAH